ncbi:hypothetical protein PVK06_007478 [Gossypium arboreum]|uniref:Uncharacterized protein n=1 Tax=Gossypium arboreum TaxID=29729 RepID=A0ABR0QHJ7_GOSAR|nr:hypothetical protein PVK06_007478 [Gossypium arboreum]
MVQPNSKGFTLVVPFVVEDVITARNVLRYCLECFNPDKYRRGLDFAVRSRLSHCTKKVEADSGKLEYHHKRRANHAGPSTVIAATPTSPSVSSPSMARKSSSIATISSSNFRLNWENTLGCDVDLPTNLVFKQSGSHQAGICVHLSEALQQIMVQPNSKGFTLAVPFVVEDVITARNVLRYCLECFNPDEYRRGLDFTVRSRLSHCTKKVEADSGKLEYHYKRRANHAGPSTVIAATPTSPPVSSPSMARKSSSIATRSSSPLHTPLYIPSILSPIQESLTKEDNELFLWRRHLNTRKYPYNPSEVVEKCKASLLEATKRHMRIIKSSNSVKNTSLTKLTSRLQVLLAEATMVNVGLGKNVGNAEASQKELEETKLELDRIRKLYLKMKKENEELYMENHKLIEVKNDKISKEVTTIRERKEALDIDIKKMIGEYNATVNRIVEKHKATMLRSEQKQTEALEEFKRETLKNLSNIAQELKSNILLHAQVVGSPFNICRVDLNALYDVDMNQIGSDVHFLSGATCDEIASKWKNSKDFFLDEFLCETNDALADNNESDEDLAKANITFPDDNRKNKDAGKEGEDEISSDHEGADDMP